MIVANTDTDEREREREPFHGPGQTSGHSYSWPWHARLAGLANTLDHCGDRDWTESTGSDPADKDTESVVFFVQIEFQSKSIKI